MNQPNAYNQAFPGTRTLDDMVNICAVMQHKQVRYWKAANDLAKMFLVTSAEYVALNHRLSKELEAIAVLHPSVSSYREQLEGKVEEMKKIMELWYEEIMDNREELVRLEPFRAILRTKFTEEQVQAKFRECDELLGVKTGEREDPLL